LIWNDSSGGTGVSLATASLKTIGDRFQPDCEAEASAIEASLGTIEAPFDRGVTLEVDRIVQTNTGALLLFFRDPHGDFARVREGLSRAFPGAPASQAAGLSCTLLRAFPDSARCLVDRSSGRAFADVKAACARWTARVRGTRIRIHKAWFVREERYSSIDGARRSFPIGSVG
jgi:hypothetical protein